MQFFYKKLRPDISRFLQMNCAAFQCRISLYRSASMREKKRKVKHIYKRKLKIYICIYCQDR